MIEFKEDEIYEPARFVMSQAEKREPGFMKLLAEVQQFLRTCFFGTIAKMELKGQKPHHVQMVMWYYRNEGWDVAYDRQYSKQKDADGKFAVQEWLCFKDPKHK